MDTKAEVVTVLILMRDLTLGPSGCLLLASRIAKAMNNRISRFKQSASTSISMLGEFEVSHRRVDNDVKR